MSLTSVAARRFTGDMRTQPQSTFSFYDNDDESPIDLRKKTVINRQKSENGNGRSHREDDEDDEGHNFSEEEESEKRSEFLKTIQKMSVLTLPQFLNPLLFVGQKDVKSLGSDGGGMTGGMINSGLPGYHQPVAVPNPYLINSLGNLYPLMSEQYGVRYALVSSPDGTHVLPVSTTGHSPYTPLDPGRMSHRFSREDAASDRMHGFSQDSIEAIKEYNHRSKANTENLESASQEGDFTGHSRPHREHSIENIFSRQACPESRCASTPPNEGCINSRKIRTLKHLRESWKSDSKLLLKHCGQFGEDPQDYHYYTPKQERRSVRELDLTVRNPSKRRDSYHPPPSLQRSLSCSDIDKKRRTPQDSIKFSHHHSGYASDSEIANTSRSSGDRCRLLSESSSPKQVSFSDLRTKKRKFYAPCSDDNNESEIDDKEETMPSKVMHCTSETNLKDPKRLKGLRSLSESSIRMKVSSADCYGPTDLSMKSSPATAPVSLHDHDTFLQQLRHMSPAGFPWNIYGYYNHLMQRFQDQEILKHHLGFDPRHTPNPPHRHHSINHPLLPAAAEAGFSPPTSPSPESSASLTSGWMNGASRERRLGEFGSNGGVDENNANDPNLRKRPSRALTGKHVKHGTGASPSTLLTLRQKIQERQKAKELGMNLDGVSSCGVPSAKHRNTSSSRKSNSSKANASKKTKSATNVKLHTQSSSSKEPS